MSQAKTKAKAASRKKAAAGKSDAPVLHARLIAYPRRRFELFCVCAAVFGVFVFLIMSQMRSQVSWVSLVVPVTMVGLALLAIPPTEDWEYTPWQNVARKVEQNFHDM